MNIKKIGIIIINGLVDNVVAVL